MKRFICVLSLFGVFLIFGKFLAAGQISVINPSAGSEITGAVSVAPQPSTSQSGSDLSTSNNVGVTDEGGQISSKYQIYSVFFKRMNVEGFTDAQLMVIKSKLVELLSTNQIEDSIRDLLKEQLGLVKQPLE